MKKIILLVVFSLLLCGCSFNKDSLEDSTIYTTIYPIKYLTEFLYKDYATVESIYPSGVNLDTYELTEKQIKNYSKGDLFIYNGLSNEKTITKNLINKNKNLLIIDVSYGLSYQEGLKELWISPNNYLMLAKNIKDNLIEYLKTKLIIEDVQKKYDELAEILSLKDAELRSISKEARIKGTNTIVVSDDVMKFLENYGFEVVSLDDNTISENSFTGIQSNFSKGTYKYIIVLDNNVNNHVDSLVKNNKAKTINFNSVTILEEGNTDDYLDNMQGLIDNIRNICLN